MVRLFAVLPLLACGHSAAVPDGATGSELPPTITISGTTTVHGTTQHGQGNITVTAKRVTDDSLVASSPTSNGAFSLTIATSPGFGDLYLVTTASTYVDAYYNFVSPLSGDAAGITIDLFTPATFDALFTTTGTTKTTGASVIEAHALSWDGFDVAGTTFTTIPQAGTVVYDDANGHVSKQASSTASDGLGYVLNAAAAAVEMDSPGGSSSSGRVRVFAGAVSEVTVLPPLGGD